MRNAKITGGGIFDIEDEFTSFSADVINQIGNKIITKYYLRRQPIQQALSTALNIISLQTFNRFLRNENIDKFFHLSIILFTDDNRPILFEKNQTVSCRFTDDNYKNGAEIIPVRPIRQMTLNDVINGMKRIQGEHSFFKYDAFHANCQDFVMAFLGAMGQANLYQTWVKQDIKKLVQQIPSYMNKFTNIVTNIGNKFDEYTQHYLNIPHIRWFRKKIGLGIQKKYRKR